MKPRREEGRTEKSAASVYLPLVSTFAFSSSFIFFTVGSRLASPVVWVVVAGGALLGMELCSAGFLAGRVAVAGGGFACALAACVGSRLRRTAKTDLGKHRSCVAQKAHEGLWRLLTRPCANDQPMLPGMKQRAFG